MTSYLVALVLFVALIAFLSWVYYTEIIRFYGKRAPKRPLFRRGHLYEVISTELPGFTSGMNLVHAFPIWSVYDGLRGDVFLDIESGALLRLELTDSVYDHFDPSKFFRHRGADMELVPIETDGIAFATHTDFSVFQADRDYVLAVIEGRAPQPSWFHWLRDNRDRLAAKMTRAEFLKLKFVGYDFAKVILAELQVPFTESPRYLWLDYCWQNYQEGDIQLSK